MLAAEGQATNCSRFAGHDRENLTPSASRHPAAENTIKLYCIFLYGTWCRLCSGFFEPLLVYDPLEKNHRPPFIPYNQVFIIKRFKIKKNISRKKNYKNLRDYIIFWVLLPYFLLIKFFFINISTKNSKFKHEPLHICIQHILVSFGIEYPPIFTSFNATLGIEAATTGHFLNVSFMIA